jgi:cellulose synthase/poly-beta-1,6-N-acetylglucosamine synthase-like glycosyltransferase
MSLRDLFLVFNGFVLVYFVVLMLSYIVQTFLGWREISEYVKRRPLRDYESVSNSELSTAVSMLVPTYNEEAVVIESIRSLLAINYPTFEIVLINDGSTDGTLERLINEFSLVKVDRVPRANVECEVVQGVYVSPSEERLVVIDKVNGGKADAQNAGLRYARYPLFCAVDSDTILEKDALQRLVWQFQVNPETVACGGIVRISNGSTVKGGAVSDVRTPKSLLPCLQIVEYLRAFLVGRSGWSRMHMLLVISGAFGMFRRDVVVDAGGYDPTNLSEDADLVIRLHRFCRDRKLPYAISFVPDPVSWTQAPTSLRVLGRQRDRWQRGLIQTLWRNRGMFGRPRYGAIGSIAMPYFLVFEMLSGPIELLGFPIVLVSLIEGWISPGVALAFLLLAITAGLAFSFGALRIEERAFQRYRRWSCLARLALAAVVENFGYRQWLAIVRTRSFATILRREQKWGEMVRVPYEAEVPVAAAATPAALTMTVDSDS